MTLVRSNGFTPSVADTPTRHQKDCWDNSYSSFQSITELLSLIPKHSLRCNLLFQNPPHESRPHQTTHA